MNALNERNLPCKGWDMANNIVIIDASMSHWCVLLRYCQYTTVSSTVRQQNHCRTCWWDMYALNERNRPWNSQDMANKHKCLINVFCCATVNIRPFWLQPQICYLTIHASSVFFAYGNFEHCQALEPLQDILVRHGIIGIGLCIVMATALKSFLQYNKW